MVLRQADPRRWMAFAGDKPGCSSNDEQILLGSYPRHMGHGEKFSQNVVHWRKEWQTTSVFLPWEPHEQYERQKDRTLKDELPRLVGDQHDTGDQWRNNSRKNEERDPKQKQCSVVMWLVIEERSNAIKSNVAYKPGLLGPWIKANWKWSSKRWQEWTSTF